MNRKNRKSRGRRGKYNCAFENKFQKKILVTTMEKKKTEWLIIQRAVKTGKVIKTVALDCDPETLELVVEQSNFSEYVRELLKQEVSKRKRAEAEKAIKKTEHVTLTDAEYEIYSWCRCYFREFGYMKYGNNYRYFPLQPEELALNSLLGDVRDKTNSKAAKTLIKKFREDDILWESFYNRICVFWRQENPVPEEWKKEVVQSLTLHDSLMKILPEIMRLKHQEQQQTRQDTVSVTVKFISDAVGVKYQEVYSKLVPLLRPILRKDNVEL
jgi:hypothetical protein